MYYNIISFAPNLARAYEIAKCGNFKIKLITSPNADETTLHEKDMSLIKAFYGMETCISDADIIIEISKPDAEHMLSCLNNTRTETKKDIDARILDYELENFPPFVGGLTGGCRSLLKVAVERLDLNFVDVVKILKVAEVISKMSGNKEYKAEHIAEAVQYLSIPVEYRY